MPSPVLLIIDDDPAFAQAMARGLGSDFDIRQAQSVDDAERHLAPAPDLVLLDIRLRGDSSDDRQGLEFLGQLRARLPDLPVVMVTAHGDIDIAVEAMRTGAVDFLQKDRLVISELRYRLRRAVEHGRMSRKIAQLEHDLSLVEPRTLIGESPQISDVKRRIAGLALDGKSTVLIRGETGTGKELVARALHSAGPRRNAPFVAVMLETLPAAMVEVELFGAEAGAYTDSRERRIGYLEKAHEGVLFLDEIAETTPEAQVKLLRFLDSLEFQRLGSTNPLRVDTQVVAATNADLKERIREGRFREDLLFRLQVHELVLPPLRERSEDIPLLVEHFRGLLARRGKSAGGVSKRAMRALMGFSWPGNIRQLRNSIEAAVFEAVLRGAHEVDLEDLPAEVRKRVAQSRRSVDGHKVPPSRWMKVHLVQAELQCVQEALGPGKGHRESWRRLGYRSQRAMSDRVTRLLSRHPELRPQFSNLLTRMGKLKDRGE